MAILANINLITAQFQSARNIDGKKPKKKSDHEKPTGVSLSAPVYKRLKYIVVQAILASLLFRHIDKI